MKRVTLSLPLVVFLLLTIVMVPQARSAVAQNGENEVSVSFTTQYNLPLDGDSFSNEETIGQTIWRIPNILNVTDQSGEQVKGLHVTLESDLAFEWVSDKNLVTVGPPVYEWHFGDLEEEHKHTGWATDVLVGFSTKSPIRFTPGLDVSRSFDKTVFTEPDTQTVTVTVTPRAERIESVEIFVHARDDELVDSDIISHSAGGQAHITADRNYSEVGEPGVGIPVEVDEPASISVTIEVTPKVPELEFKPHVGIKPNWQQSEPDSGTSLGSSISYTNEAGIWTVSAEGDYRWNWGAPKEPGYNIDFHPWGNAAPILMAGSVTPSSGDSAMPFSFRVAYIDKNRDYGGGAFDPSCVRIYIDETAYDMGYVGGDYSEGATFNYTTRLNPGHHSYYFEASDGFLTARLPEHGTLSVEVKSSRFPIWVIVILALGLGLGIFFFIRRRRRRTA